MGLRVLYISYWGFNEGITQSSVIRHLPFYCNNSLIDEFSIVTVERYSTNRNNQFVRTVLNENCSHYSLHGNPIEYSFHNRFLNFISLSRNVCRIIHEFKPDVIICRSIMAYSLLGYRMFFSTKAKLVIDSFEPHASYMVDNLIWSKWSFRYLVFCLINRFAVRNSDFLITVNENYKKYLEKVNSRAKIYTIPCTVDLKLFQFSLEDRDQIRSDLKIDNATKALVYSGKFGGLYFSVERAVNFLKGLYDAFDKKLHVIILTNDSLAIEKIRSNPAIENFISIFSLSLNEVPKFLSASDFAVSLVNSTKSSKYSSPIKNGEYWANGLPVIIPDGIGEDSEIILREKLGVVFESGSNDFTTIRKQMDKIWSQPDWRNYIMSRAKYHRRDELLNQTINSVLLQIKPSVGRLDD